MFTLANKFMANFSKMYKKHFKFVLMLHMLYSSTKVYNIPKIYRQYSVNVKYTYSYVIERNIIDFVLRY